MGIEHGDELKKYFAADEPVSGGKEKVEAKGYTEKAFGLIEGIAGKYHDQYDDEGIDKQIETTLSLVNAGNNAVEGLKAGDEENSAQIDHVEGLIQRISEKHQLSESISNEIVQLFNNLDKTPRKAKFEQSLAENLSHTIKNDSCNLGWVAEGLSHPSRILPERLEEFKKGDKFQMEMIEDDLSVAEKSLCRTLWGITSFLRGLHDMSAHKSDIVAENQDGVGYMDRSYRQTKFMEQLLGIDQILERDAFQRIINGDIKGIEDLKKYGIGIDEVKSMEQSGVSLEEMKSNLKKKMVNKIKPLQEPWEQKFNQLEEIGFEY